jgi:hypothetical protein
MADAMVALATITLGSTATSVSFASIPSTFRDLRLIVVGTQTTTGNGSYLRFNSDSTTSYSFVSAEGNGSVRTSYGWEDTYMYFAAAYNSGDTTVPSVEIIDIFDYAQDKHKTAIARISSPAREVAMGASRWYKTAAINSILVSGQFTSFKAGTTFSLYGIVG